MDDNGVNQNESTFSTFKKTIYTVHFWIVFCATIIFTLLYQVWPWRDFNLVNDPWSRLSWISNLDFIPLIETQLKFFGILFMLPIVYGSLLNVYGAILAWVVSLITIVPLSYFMNSSLAATATNIFVPLLPLLIVFAITLEQRWRNKERKIAAARESERQIYLAKIFEAEENERKRIALELHDDTIQTLLVIANQAETMLSSDCSSEEKTENAIWIRDTAMILLKNLRRMCRDLRPSILDDAGLEAAIQWIVERMNKETAIHVQYFGGGLIYCKLSNKMEINIFRIVQEALSNIRQHSNAQEAIVRTWFKNNMLHIMIEDDGIGFNTEEMVSISTVTDRLGLIGIQERVKMINGTCTISSTSGEGTIIKVQIKCH